ncbi:unnamed protein product, partial [Brassica rapa]
MDSHRRPVCADGHTRTATDDLCVLTDTHGRPVCADGHPRMSSTDYLCVLTDTHGHPVCADGHPRTSYVCWRTPTDVLCVLNRQPTWDNITQTVHGIAQRADSNDQRADMCTDGQPRMSCVHTDTHRHTRTAMDVLCVLMDSHRRPVLLTDSHRRPVCAGGHPRTSCVRPMCADRHTRTSYSPRGPKSPEQSTGRASVLSPRTSVLICVLMDSHRRPVCADGDTRTHTDSHGCLVCADGQQETQPTWAKITRAVHGKGQRAESKDQLADMSTDVPCVLTDTHGQPRTTSTDVLCVLTDSHKQPRTYCVCWRTPRDVPYSPRGPKSPKHSTGRASVLSPRTNLLSPRTKVLICVLMDSHGHPV